MSTLCPRGSFIGTTSNFSLFKGNSCHQAVGGLDWWAKDGTPPGTPPWAQNRNWRVLLWWFGCLPWKLPGKPCPTVDGQNPFRTTLIPWLKLLFAGIFQGNDQKPGVLRWCDMDFAIHSTNMEPPLVHGLKTTRGH